MLADLFLGTAFIFLIVRMAIPNPETYRWVIADFFIAFFTLLALFFLFFPPVVVMTSIQYNPSYNVINNGNTIQYPAYNITTNSTTTSEKVPISSTGFMMLTAFGIAMLIFSAMLGIRDFIFASQTHQW